LDLGGAIAGRRSDYQKQLTKALIEQCLTAELVTHLEEEKKEKDEQRPKNRRNGHFSFPLFVSSLDLIFSS
jgi:transposase-like protein